VNTMDAAIWPGVRGLVPECLLGGGGGGTVWGCFDGSSRVAVKIAARTPRLERELEAQRRLGAAAPRLIRCTNADDGRAAIVMEWLAGETLAARLARMPAWSLEAIAELASALAARIDATHAQGIAHRDLKPANIWLDTEGTVRLIDFGLALLDERATVEDPEWATRGDVIGTPRYMAPEQALGEPSGRAADIYSFGAILFEVITGRAPFDGADARIAHASRRAPSVSALAPHAAVFDDVIAACLAKRPEDRPRTARDVADALRARLGASSVATLPNARRRDAQQGAIALLGIPHPIELRALADAVAGAGGIVAKVCAAGYVVAFPGLAPAHGIAKARLVAASLAVTSTIHVDEVAVRRGARGVRVTGAAIDDAPAWWTAGVTPEARAFLSDDAHPATSSALVDAPLVGRDDELATITRLAREALSAGRSQIIAIVGEAGVGTSRLLAEAVARLGDVRTIDAAHRVDASVLDAADRGVTIVAAQPSLFQRRPAWAEHAARVELGALDAATTMTLLRALLAPVEYIAESALAALAALSGGIPGHAVEIVRQLHAIGAIRTSETGGAYLAADELARLSATELATSLASRVLSRLAPDVRRFAQVAAVLRDNITPDRLLAIREAIGDQIEVDAGVALARLAAEQIVIDGAVRHAILGDAIAETLPAAERAELHRAALATCTDLHARARHAEGAGETTLASNLLARIGDAHRDARRDVDAERAYTSALEHLRESAPRAAALYGRGVVRCNLHRLVDADADLAAAEMLATGSLLALIHLQRATVADWSERWADAARHVESVVIIDSELLPKLQMARGRAAFRAGDLDRARTELAAAAGAPDHETSAIAKMLLGTVLVTAGDLDGAQTVLDGVIAACEAAGDRLHLCSALNDRMWLWIKRDLLERGIADQRAATMLAKELGHPHLERSSTYNLAELLHWRGSFDEALVLAQRSRWIQQRFVGASPLDALLIARIEAARGEVEAAARELAWIDATCGELTGANAMQRDVVRLAVAGNTCAAAWDRAIADARATTVLYELAEALWFAARTTRDARWTLEGRALGHPSWNDRFEVLEPGGTP
jgi:hypothetical protein